MKKPKIGFFLGIFFIFFSLIYLSIGIFSGLLGCRGNDCIWTARNAYYLPTFDPYSHNIAVGVAPPHGISTIYPPIIFFLIYPFIYLGNIFVLQERKVQYKPFAQ